MQKSLFFNEAESIKVKAIYLGERIETRALETTSLLATSPMIFEVNKFSYAAVFKYGVVVLFDVAPLDEVSFLSKLGKLVFQKSSLPEIDNVEVILSEDGNEGIMGNSIILKKFDLPKIQLIAELFAKNVVLSYYERSVSSSFDSIEPLAENLQKKSTLSYNSKELIKHIGETLLQMHKMVARVEVSEKPDILWENQDLERFYAKLEDEYEIKERHQAIERKVELISRTAETALNLLQAQRSLRVEWYVVALIVVEILFSIYDIFIK
ncbi:MAG: hypothetical protein CO129_02710 [Ignavibacteriales bacterium CG_4_9_14_3_um_filter_34_10]|nr:MAG: hypothetical protein CO129_02710 [Ignavibacteriales bacterium CG_4_9_14_3_um_filter_34_10]